MTIAARPRISAVERRDRLARRHAIVPESWATDVEEVTDRIVALHATDPSTTYLSCWARMPDMAVADLDRALYDERSLVKHMAMRRTLFIFDRQVLPLAQAAASSRVATAERKRLIKEVEKGGLHRDGAAWLDAAGAAVTAALADGRELTSTELREELPVLQGTITYAEGKSYGGQMPVGPRVLTILSAEGHIVRASNLGRWSTSRPRWASMPSWLGDPLERITPEVGTTAMVERWLRSFGPGTEVDLKWWLGSTLTAVRAALVELEAVPVDLDDGATGYVLPDDVGPDEPVGHWTALLPPLDPATMGWFDRAWYLGDHKAQVFDSNGNGGPAAWCDGRIVGGWRQDADGVVELQLLEDVSRGARTSFAAQAAKLTEWFDGQRVLLRFPSPLSKALGGT